jgi:hypothetical protein
MEAYGDQPPSRLARSLAMTSVLIVLALRPLAAGSLRLDLEGGLASTRYNDIRIPGDKGTAISFSDELKSNQAGFWRLRLIVPLGERHELLALAAPLRFEASGSVAREVIFKSDAFPANAPLAGDYRFDSYRLTYRYAIRHGKNPEISLGLTAKIRDASVRLQSGSLSAEKSNTGLVPLINFRVRVKLRQRTSLLIEGDALAAPQGRAEDVLLALERELNDSLSVRVGYRLLEGGADNEEVYTFSWINYLTAGLALRF